MNMTKDHPRLMAFIDKTRTGSKRTNELSRGNNTSTSKHDRPAVFIEPSKQHNQSTKIIKKR